MPHKGRPYPFHPTYWATEAWFWPGFVPWKLVAVQTDGGIPYYGCSPGTSFPVSEPGVPTTDGKRIMYRFFPVSDCLVVKMEVTMEKGTGGEGVAAAWTVEAWYSDGHHDLLHDFQLYPQRVVSSPEFSLSVTVDECGEDVFLKCRFVPATYEEGGSPWD